jgi:hypothetical protein
VPEKADGYAIELPEGVKEDELDMDLLTPLREGALEAGVPPGLRGAGRGRDRSSSSTSSGDRDAENGSRDELFKEWGGAKGRQARRRQQRDARARPQAGDVAAMQRGFAMQYGEPGSKRTLELLQKLGAGIAEDTLLGGDGPRRFGITGAEAQAEIDKLIVDKEFGEEAGAKDPDAVARWDRLNAAVAAERDRKERARAGG